MTMSVSLKQLIDGEDHMRPLRDPYLGPNMELSGLAAGPGLSAEYEMSGRGGSSEFGF